MKAKAAILTFALSMTSAAAAQTATIPDDTKITLERTSCYGECPVYSLSIDGQGNVVYDGVKYVRVDGRQTGRVPPSQVASILEEAERIGFFDLDGQYRSLKQPDGSSVTVSDWPTTIITMTVRGRSKRVEDYAGAPPALKDFERLIDVVARTKPWIFIDTDTIDQLVRDGWAPTQEERAQLLRKAVDYDDVDVVRALISRGVAPDARNYLGGARSGAVVRLLFEAGADPNATNEAGGTPLGQSTYAAPEVAEALLKAGAVVDAPFLNTQTPLFHAACLGNVDVVAILLAAGADPRVRHFSSGVSAVDCAREGRAAARASYQTTPPPFVRDFDRVIALLEEARARERR